MHFKRSRIRGFTLMEIMIITLIIAVLSALAYPLYRKSVNRARMVEAVSLIQIIRDKQTHNFSVNKVYLQSFDGMGQLTTSKISAGFTGTTAVLGAYTIKLNPAANCLTVRYFRNNVEFTLAAGYEKPGLGCSGDICGFLGENNLIGTAQEVCN